MQKFYCITTQRIDCNKFIVRTMLLEPPNFCTHAQCLFRITILHPSIMLQTFLFSFVSQDFRCFAPLNIHRFLCLRRWQLSMKLTTPNVILRTYFFHREFHGWSAIFVLKINFQNFRMFLHSGKNTASDALVSIENFCGAKKTRRLFLCV